MAAAPAAQRIVGACWCVRNPSGNSSCGSSCSPVRSILLLVLWFARRKIAAGTPQIQIRDDRHRLHDARLLSCLSVYDLGLPSLDGSSTIGRDHRSSKKPIAATRKNART